jgi:uncharacterized caspase-like protein/uncharacterized protein
MKKAILCLVLLTGLPIWKANAQQTVTQEQCQQADAQLNQVYQQLRATLNDTQKQQLKQAQRDWIKNRDAYVAAFPGNPQGALYQATMQRVRELQGVVQQVKGKESADSQREQTIKATDRQKALKKTGNNSGDIKTVYQEVQYDKIVPVSKVIGNKNTIVSINNSEKIFIFDNKTKLLISEKNVGGALGGENSPPVCLMLDASEKYILSHQRGHKGFRWTITDADTLETILSEPGGPGRFYPVMFFEDKLGNLGVFEGGEVDQAAFGYSKFESLSSMLPYLIKYNSLQTTPFISYAKNYPDIAKRIGCFITNISHFGNKKIYINPLAEKLLLSCTSLNDGMKSNLYDFNTNKIINIIKRFEKERQIVNADLPNLITNISTVPLSYYAEINGSIAKISFLNGRTNYTLELDIETLKTKKKDLESVAILHPFESIKIGSIPFQATKSTDPQFSQSIQCVPRYSGDISPRNIITLSSSSKSIATYPPPNYLNEIYDGGVIPTMAYVYKGSNAPVVCLWNASGKWLGDPQIGIWNKDAERWVLTTNAQCIMNGRYEACSHYWDPTYDQVWIAQSNTITSFSAKTGQKISTIDGITPFEVFAVSSNQIIGIPRMEQPFAEIWNREPLQKVCNLTWSDDGKASLYADDGYYSTLDSKNHPFAFRVGDSAYPFEQFDLRLNRPDIVLDRLGAPKEAIETAKSLRDKRLKRMGVTEDMLKPDFHLPELQIVGDVPVTTPKDQLDLQIKASDDKYPLDRLRVYVNNVPVNGRDGELLRDQKTQSLEKTIPIKLAAGRNKIQVSVLNNAGAESLYANAEVNCSAERPKPKLYAVALGVSQYDRPEWCLKYAAKDASDLINTLKAKAGSSYSEVKPLLLTDKEVTKESATKIKEFLSGATIDDTVLIFMAGHGLLDDKYDYYFGTTDIDPAKPSERGMPYEAIDTILAEVPSLKKALLMDTCHAGELDDDEKKELAASDGTATPSVSPDTSSNSTNSSPLAGKVAMRAIGTRGMKVKAVEGAKGKSDWYEKLQDMFVDLRRGSGATVISSSQGAEYAFESSDQSNGLFTYALMEALDGKATPNKEGQINISSIGDYVKKRVQDLTKGKQNPNLRGVNLEEDFTLGSTK